MNRKEVASSEFLSKLQQAIQDYERCLVLASTGGIGC